MTKAALLPLDSYRLAQYAVQVPCYVCEGGNTFDSELCRHCFAPMALAHQATSQKLRPQMMAAIGSSGVGKTVYLGMLMDMLSRRPDRMQLLARGAFSVTLQQMTIGALAGGDFPSKTSNEPDRWNWVHSQIRTSKHRRPVELIMPDMAGEAILEEVDHPNSFPVIRSLLEKCAGVLLLIDSSDLEGGSREQDYFAIKLLNYLNELCDDPKAGWSKRPVALVFSKADECEHCFEDPASYARAHASGVWQICQERFSVHRFFAAGVAGACATRRTPSGTPQRYPLRIEPRGIIEPFEWLVSMMRS